ncbi:hypothetical protein D3C72_1118910 [compost metagenome]
MSGAVSEASPFSQPSAGRLARGRPAWRNSRRMSLPHCSTTCWRAWGCGPHTTLPVVSSTHTARCRLLTWIGDLPAMNHVVVRTGHSASGSPPVAVHTSTCRRSAGCRVAISPGSSRSARSASTMRRNSGAAASTPTSAGLLVPSKLPTHTTSTWRPNTPAVHASRKPHDVPVFHAMAGRAGSVVSGRGVWRSMSSVMNEASSLKRRSGCTGRSSGAGCV